MKRLVFSVTYNEAENIKPLVTAVRGQGYDLLIVDDPGDDGTAGLVREMQVDDPHLFLIERTGRRGYAAAGRDGMYWARARGYDQIVQLDADGSHRPERIPVLFRALDEADMAIGSRYVFGGSIPGLTFFRRLISHLAGWYLRFLLGLAIKDPTSGFRAWRMEFLMRVLEKSGQATGFSFLYETAYWAQKLGGRIREIPIRFDKRHAGESKMSLQIVRDAIRVVRLLRRQR